MMEEEKEEIFEAEYLRSVAYAIKNGELSEKQVDMRFVESIKPWINREVDNLDDCLFL